MGGRRALTGRLHTIASQSLANVAKVGPQLLAGIGWNPEDLHANPVKWQLFGEVGWRDSSHAIADIGSWIDGYANRRYAPARATPTLLAAWRTLLAAAYGGDRPAAPDAAAVNMAMDGRRATAGSSAGLAAARDAPAPTPGRRRR